MMIDSLAGTITTLAPGVKLEKKPDSEAPRPVEGSEESQDSHLDVDRERLARQEMAEDPPGQHRLGAATYNARGDLTEKSSSNNSFTPTQTPIDLIV